MEEAKRSVEDEQQLVGNGAKLRQMFCFSEPATPHLGGDKVCSMAVILGAKGGRIGNWVWRTLDQVGVWVTG